MEAYEDDIEDVTKGNGSSNVIKELKRFTGLYALGSTIFSTSIDCQELTVVDVSSVHHMWVRWCNFPNAQQHQESHLLKMGLFPVSYKTSSLLSHSGYSMMHGCPTLNANHPHINITKSSVVQLLQCLPMLLRYDHQHSLAIFNDLVY